jgi:hypothetical protein
MFSCLTVSAAHRPIAYNTYEHCMVLWFSGNGSFQRELEIKPFLKTVMI